jgi:hypothetical protein
VLIFFSGDIPVHDCDDRGELCALNGWVEVCARFWHYRYHLSDSPSGRKIETWDSSSSIHIDGDERDFSVGSSVTTVNSGVFSIVTWSTALWLSNKCHPLVVCVTIFWCRKL